MTKATLELDRGQILAFRRRVQALDERLPMRASSLRQAAWAGLQDSMPRAALLSIHARVSSARSDSWADRALVQVWGPRFQVYVVPAQDHALFTLARYPDDARGRKVAEDMAARVGRFLAGRTLRDREVGAGLGIGNAMRYGTATGTILIRWEGALAPRIWTVDRPEIEPAAARDELARRFLHVFGPTTAAAFTKWAGIGAKQASVAFEALERDLIPVRTPIGEAFLLATDEAAARARPGQPAPARFLPSGDPFWLWWGTDRELLVPNPKRRGELWTSRVWPGALLVDGELAGTWRRAGSDLDIDPWRKVAAEEREAVEHEAATLPLPGLKREIRVRWSR
ncbi:MAG TPA: crosslink repair DNA glycosylase YcaQ family protein [Candidatus Limnocylindrales bacterium]|nr:crosslink repair DNA glycosylase YcaQ family protein [Candidatus Limnocylindrales bacterium]